MEKFAALDTRVKNLEGVFSTSSDADAKMVIFFALFLVIFAFFLSSWFNL